MDLSMGLVRYRAPPIRVSGGIRPGLANFAQICLLRSRFAYIKPGMVQGFSMTRSGLFLGTPRVSQEQVTCISALVSRQSSVPWRTSYGVQ